MATNASMAAIVEVLPLRRPIFRDDMVKITEIKPPRVICRSRRQSVAAFHDNGRLRITRCLSSKKDMGKLIESDDGGPSRWFSPSDCGPPWRGSPLLLYLPGIDGDGLGLKLQHERLGEIFHVRCLHIPHGDRTPLEELVKLVMKMIESEHKRLGERPTYLVGESFGASLALVVAAQNPNIDLSLILANPATCLSSKSWLQRIVTQVSDSVYKHLHGGLIDRPISSIPEETITWKLKMADEMQNNLNTNLHAVKAQTVLILESTGKNARLPNTSSEGQRLRRMLQRCEIRFFTGNRQPLFMDENFDLVATIKRVSHYRGDRVDYVSDFLPPTPLELKKSLGLDRLIKFTMDPVMLSTKDRGEIVEGLSGIPSEGPVLLVGNHLLIAMDVIPLFSKFWVDHNIKLRALAHPLFFERFKDGIFPELSQLDFMRVCGAVPVSPTNLYKLLSSNSHVLLYPRGVREAFHNKGEEYRLFWPVEPEFVRIAARFGAKIVPFGAVGEDDVAKLLLDCNEQMKIPPLRAIIQEINSATTTLRIDSEGEVGKQILYYPIFQPKLPGRLYFLFGKPIPTQGRTDILTNRDKAREVYIEVQREIEKCIAYLKEKREEDPYRNLLARLVYRASNGFDSQIPTFEI